MRNHHSQNFSSKCPLPFAAHRHHPSLNLTLMSKVSNVSTLRSDCIAPFTVATKSEGPPSLFLLFNDDNLVMRDELLVVSLFMLRIVV